MHEQISKEHKLCDREIAGLRALLKRYVDEFPAFRSKPIGAPGSAERARQDAHIALEDAVRDELSPVGQALGNLHED